MERTKAAGLRQDIGVADLSLLFEQLQAIDVGDADRSRELRRRHLALMLDGLHRPGAEPLPGPPPSWGEMSARYG